MEKDLLEIALHTYKHRRKLHSFIPFILLAKNIRVCSVPPIRVRMYGCVGLSYSFSELKSTDVSYLLYGKVGGMRGKMRGGGENGGVFYSYL